MEASKDPEEKGEEVEEGDQEDTCNKDENKEREEAEKKWGGSTEDWKKWGGSTADWEKWGKGGGKS